MIDVEQVFRRLTTRLSPAAGPLIRSGWVYQYILSPISLWCDLHAPQESKDSINPFTQYLFDQGKSHETNVLADLYPGAIREYFSTEEDGFRRALELMAEGVGSMHNMPLLCGLMGLEGRPDVLEKVDGVSSDLGDYSYRVVEIKSARRLRESQILQGALYNRLLGIVQGYQPPEFQMINGDTEIIEVMMSDVDHRLDQVLAEVREIMAGKSVEFCYGVARWPWTSYVDSRAIEANDVSLITGVGSSVRTNLVAAGYATLESIAAANETELVSVKRVGSASARKMMVSAQALQGMKPLRREELEELRHGKTEVFFDFEGAQEFDENDGLELVNYLIGAVSRTPGQEAQYTAFFADTFEQEDENLTHFLEWANSLEDPVFYHWHHYEKTHLTKMVERYGVDPELAAVVLERLEDLSPWATKGYAFPAYGEGLKAIAKSLGFKWQQDDVSGVGSMGLYLRYVESGGTDEVSKEKIIVYNEDDCFATMHIYDWVMAQER